MDRTAALGGERPQSFIYLHVEGKFALVQRLAHVSAALEQPEMTTNLMRKTRDVHYYFRVEMYEISVRVP